MHYGVQGAEGELRSGYYYYYTAFEFSTVCLNEFLFFKGGGHAHGHGHMTTGHGGGHGHGMSHGHGHGHGKGHAHMMSHGHKPVTYGHKEGGNFHHAKHVTNLKVNII